MMLTKRLQIVGKDFVNAYRLMSFELTSVAGLCTYSTYIYVSIFNSLQSQTMTAIAAGSLKRTYEGWNTNGTSRSGNVSSK